MYMMTGVKTAGLIFICFPLLHGFVAALNCTSPTPEALLDAFEKELFPRKLLRPVKHFSDTLNISITMTVVGILGVNEKAQSLTMYIWQLVKWNIAGLSWDVEECGTARVSIPREKLWVPDIQIAEFMDEDVSPNSPYVYLYNTGQVYDGRPRRVVATCKLGIYTFPFDVQNCTLTFESFLHFSEEVQMIQSHTVEHILHESKQVQKTKGEWELVDIRAGSTALEIKDGSYSELVYYIILRRRPILYVVNLLIPSCFLITLDLFSFLLPPHSVDRSAFKMTLILGYTVFLLLMNDLLPVNGESTPLMNVFFFISFALMVGSLLETVFITNIHFSSSMYGEVPHWLNVLVLRYLAVIVCLPKVKKSNRVTVTLHPPQPHRGSIIASKDFENISISKPPEKKPLDPVLDELQMLSRDLTAIRVQMDKHFQGSKTQQEWKMIGIVVDRLLFGLYLAFISISFIAVVLIWVWSNVVLEDRYGN